MVSKGSWRRCNLVPITISFVLKLRELWAIANHDILIIIYLSPAKSLALALEVSSLS